MSIRKAQFDCPQASSQGIEHYKSWLSTCDGRCYIAVFSTVVDKNAFVDIGFNARDGKTEKEAEKHKL